MFVCEEKSSWNEWLFFPPLIDREQDSFSYSGNSSQLSYMLGRKNNYRVWMLRTGSPLPVVVWNAECGLRITDDFHLMARGTDWRSLLWPFHMETPLPIAQTPSESLFSLLQTQWQSEESDLRFASRFASLPDLEQRLQGVQTRMGTPFEFAQLIQSALRAFAARWPVNIVNLKLEFGATGAGFRFSLEGDHVFGIRERAILGHIVRAFEPRQLADSPDLPLCVRTLTEGGWSRSFSIEVARPSMHERLEAMLELCAWLERHWPDGVRHLGKVVHS